MGHHHHHPELKGKKLILSIILNSAITIAQVLGGIMAGSLALLSDALHNFSDIVALLVSYIADRLTKRKFTTKQTFGFKRAEIIAAAINASTLLLIAGLLCQEAIKRIANPSQIDPLPVIILAALSIVINGLCVLLLKREAESNLNIRSAYLHLFSDMLTSIAVMAGGIAMYYFNIFWLDSLLSILVAIYLVWSSWGLLIQTLKVLMQFTPDHLSVAEIEKEILMNEKIKNVHHVHLWQLNDHDIHFEAHLDFYSDHKLSEISPVIKKIASQLDKKFHIHHVILQSEIGVDDSKDLVVQSCQNHQHHRH